MTKNTFFSILGGIGISLFAYCRHLWKSTGPARVQTAEFQQRFPPDKGKITFEQLSRIWRDPATVSQIPSEAAEFSHPELTDFFRAHILKKPFFTGKALDAVVELLHLLDDHGDCPSVVNKNPSEAEIQIDIAIYRLLEGIPLYVHTLHVAEEAIMRAGKSSLLPKAVIASLAHDLGKVPAYYGRYCRSATHAFAAIPIIESLPAVRLLKFYDDVISAVKNHHLQSDACLDILIRESDQAARRREKPLPGR